MGAKMGDKSAAFRNRSTKLLILYALLLLLVAAFLYSAFRTIHSDRHLPRQTATIHDRALRGKIVSRDGYTLSLPHKTYKAIVYAPSIDPGKRALFVRLFSIYSGRTEEAIEQSFLNKKGKPKRGYITLAKAIDAGSAIHLKSLAYKLRRLRVFLPVKNRRGINIVYGLDIIESGEQREFPLHDVLEPVLGYIRNHDDGKYVEVKGVKGLERHYAKYLASKQNGWIKGQRDVAGNILRNGHSEHVGRIDGMNLHLNIPLSLQRRIEFAVDAMKEETGAREILAGVMESRTGRVVSLVSSERYDPAHIRQDDVEKLNPKFGEYPYEAGSVIKPLTLAIALDKRKVTPQTWFSVRGGKLKISEKFTISDDEVFDSLTATDIIVHSSNVGISQIAWRLTGQQFHDGLAKFGLGQPSGIDLSRELHGKIKSRKLLAIKIHRANQSYGYGMTATFAQLLKAYNAFNNDGIAVTPRIIDYFEDTNGTRYRVNPKYGDRRAVSQKTARQIKTILKEVVARGTGVKAQSPGLEIGGKTGTAHIAIRGRYRKVYNSSFYGFANDDKGHKYTIGVLVIRASKYHKYFASQSAVPTFKSIVDVLVDQEFLQPDLTEVQREELAEKERKRRELATKKQKQRTRQIKAKLKAQREAMLRKQRKQSRKRKHKSPRNSRPPHRPTHAPATTPPKKKHPTPHDIFPDMF
jgi:cell division protein FtsI (penicillin-binding protein 3)